MNLELVKRQIILQESFSEQPNIFAARVSNALNKPPIQGEIYKNGWTEEYTRALQKVNTVCKEEQICDHGLEHLMHVAKNALFLSDLVKDQAKKGYSRFLRSEKWESLITDSAILFVVLKSDLGYGDAQARVEKYSVPDHAKRSATGIEIYKKDNSVPTTNESRKMVNEQYGMFHQALAYDLEEALSSVENLQTQNGLVTPKEVFTLIPKVADGLDYFRNGRVARLHPRAYKDNPYYHIADAVETYTLSNEGGAIKYKVRLRKDNYVATHEGIRLFDFSTWYTESNRHFDRNYSHVWELSRAFASIIGKEFKVGEME